jgi:hypothetical protein
VICLRSRRITIAHRTDRIVADIQSMARAYARPDHTQPPLP